MIRYRRHISRLRYRILQSAFIMKLASRRTTKKMKQLMMGIVYRHRGAVTELRDFHANNVAYFLSKGMRNVNDILYSTLYQMLGIWCSGVCKA